MLDILFKYFQAEGTESGKTEPVDEENLLLDDAENNQEPETTDNTNDSESGYQKVPDDAAIEEYESNLEKIKQKIEGKDTTKQNGQKTTEGKTEGSDNVLFDPDKEKQSEDQQSKGKTDGLVRITDEYIASQPAEYQEILQSIKNTTADQKVLKNYINAQLLIRDVKAGKIQEPTNGTTIPKTEEELKVAKADFLIKNLSEFPDLSEDVFKDEESLEEYIADLQMHSPLRAKKFTDKYFEVEKQFNKHIDEYTNLAQNWESMARAVVVNAVKQFDSYLTKKGIKASDLGIKYTEKFILDNFLTPNGSPNPEIVKYADSKGDIPIVDGKALLIAMKDKYDDQLTEAIKNIGKRYAYEEIEQQEAPPSISTSNFRRREEMPEPLGLRITDDMTPEQMEKVLEKQKQQIAKKY